MKDKDQIYMVLKKTVLVTGANRGIGREIARQLAMLGWQVIVTARDLAKAEAASTDIGHEAVPQMLDVVSEDSIRHVAAEIEKRFGKLDALVNNAGIIGNRSMLDFDLAQIGSVMDTNFMGPIRTSKFLMPLLRKSGDGRIINISSGMGDMASLETGGYGAYRLSKASLNAFTILLAAELKNSAVKVMGMCPGWVKTDMGGPGATRSVEKGAETAVWLATSPDAKSGKSYRDKKVIPW